MKKRLVLCFALPILMTQAALASAPNLGSIWDQETNFKNILELSDFTVNTSGQLLFLDLTQKFCEGVWPSGFGFNSDSPYLVFKMDPLATGFQAMSFWMRPDEAIVFIGQTPPEVLYFSFTAFLNVRFFPKEGTAKLLMANLGDSINMLNIKTSGTPDGLTGNPFSQFTMVILAADCEIAERVRTLAALAGYPSQVINILPIPAYMTHLGLTPSSDRLAVVLRCAFFKDSTAGDIYLGRNTMSHGESISPFGAVWRVTPKTAAPTAPVHPFTDQPLQVRGTGVTEFNLLGHIEKLRAAILDKYSGYEAVELDGAQWVPEGAEAIQRGINVLAPTRDSWYIRTQGQFTLADDEFIIVYGVNHKATGKALYSNAVVYAMDLVDTNFPFLPNIFGEHDWREYLGLVSINTEEDYQNTASAFLPPIDVPRNAKGEDMLYAVKIARSFDQSDGVACYTIPPPTCAREKLNEFMIGFRAYIDSRMKIGAPYGEMILDRVIKFSPKR